MNTDNNDDIKKAIHELRSDVRSVLTWVRFIGLVVLTLLVVGFWPLINQIGLAPLFGITIAILVAGLILSHLSPKKPQENGDTEQ